MLSHLMPAASPDSRGNALPLLVAALASACYICMDSVIKLLALRFDALQLGFFRFAGGSVFAVALWLWKRPALPNPVAWRLHLVRSALLLCSLLSYFHALTQLPLALANRLNLIGGQGDVERS